MANSTLSKNTAFLKSLGLQAAPQKEESLYVPGFKRTISPYVPSVSPDVKLYECLDCGDKFVLKSSYDMHINRHSATIEHVCKICRQANVFLNPCQVLAHARRHTNYSLEVNQENLNNLTVTPITQQQFKTNCLKFYEHDLDHSIEQFRGQSTSDNSQQPNAQIQNGVQNPGLLILPPNQNGVSNLINPFSNHNFILTDNGIVAVPNVPGAYKTPALAPQQNEQENSNVASDSVNGTSKSVLKNQKKSVEIKTSTSPIKQEPVSQESTKKPQVKIKDIGSLLKISASPNVTKSLVKTGPSPVVAWSTNGERICVECNTYVKPSLSLREHYSTLIGLANPPTCNICHIQLPSKCALSCHMRLHSELPPFVCPDCVLKFPTFNQLLDHMNKICFHLDKRVRQKCPVENCKAKVFPNVLAYRKHLVTFHTRSIYKCNLCPIACYTEISLNSHMKDKHYGCTETPSPYHQCSLCPDRLIPKSRFDQHVEEHVQNSPKMNMYLCKTCNKFNMMRNNHVAHIANCSGKGTKRSNDETSNNTTAKKVKVDLKTQDKHRVIKTDADSVVLTSLSNGGSMVTKKTVKTNCFDCKRELSCTFTGENEQQLPIRCPLCYKNSSKRIAKLPCPALVKIDPKVTKDKKTTKADKKIVEVDVDKIREKKIVDVQKVRERKIVEVDVENISDFKWKVKKKVMDIMSDNSDNKMSDLTLIKIDRNNVAQKIPSGIEIYQKRMPDKIHNEASKEPEKMVSKNGHETKIKEEKIDEAPVEQNDIEDDKQEEVQQNENKVSDNVGANTEEVNMEIEEQPAAQPIFECAICQFSISEREQFKFHVATHRDVDTAYQCMECGLSFAVKPTLEKHLRMKHSIEDVDTYVTSNSDCVDKEAVRAALASVIVGATAEDIIENQCRICKEKFDNAADHDKHFRVHGLAFLKQKELDKITSETT